MVLRLGDAVGVGSLVAKKVVVDKVALFNIRTWSQQHSSVSHTLLWIWGVVSLRILLQRCGLRWVASTIALIVATILVRWLRRHRGIQQILIIPTRLDESLVELCEVI